MLEKIFDMRLVATVVIWIASVFILSFVSGAAVNSRLDVTAVAIATLIVACISTASVWLFAALSETPSVRSETEAEKEKAKRYLQNNEDSDARTQLLLQLLSSEEKARLKSRLLNDVDSNLDGELSLNELLVGQKFLAQGKRYE